MLALRRTVSVAARRLAPVSATAVRAFSSKNEGSMSTADITKYFNELDATAAKDATAPLPIKLSGRSGAIVEEMYNKNSKGFDKLVKELEGMVAIIQGAGLVVDRFFSTTNYNAEELRMVVDLLTTSKEPLTSFEGIKSAEVREMIVDNEGNMDAWRNARKAVAALAPSKDVVELLEQLASEARLDLLKKVAEKAAALRAVTTKSVEAMVTSAVALSKEQQAAISKALPTYAPSGTALNVSFSVDPAVLGGFMVSLQNQIIDLSATTRLVEVSTARMA